jgi:hypothetical protein
MTPFLKASILAAGIAGISTAVASASPVCLQAHQVRYTSVQDPRTIDFRMEDGTVWRNHLRDACIGLTFNGFVDVLRGTDEICENMQIIRVIHTGETCVLGDFSKLSPAHA